MTQATVTIQEIHEDYCKFIDNCCEFNYFTRSKRIQKIKVKECEQYLQVIKAYKQQAIEQKVEFLANKLFHQQCMINAMRTSLLMWIELKEENFQAAWSYLVDAQEYTSVALKIEDYEGIRNLESHLQHIEASIFPGWAVYNSSGHTETIGKCSICDDHFSNCDHVENNVYMGRLCMRVDRKIIEFDHVAIVENPHDRRCIITKVSDESGRMIDHFTKEDTGEVKDEDGNMYAEVIAFSFASLDMS